MQTVNFSLLVSQIRPVVLLVAILVEAFLELLN
jgi:hypothetical protein